MTVGLGSRDGWDRMTVAAVHLTEGRGVRVGPVQARADRGNVARELGVGTLVGFWPRPRDADELDPVFRAVALEEPGDVNFDPLFGDAELGRDVLVGLSARDAAEDHVLPGGERPLDRHERKYIYFRSLPARYVARIGQAVT